MYKRTFRLKQTLRERNSETIEWMVKDTDWKLDTPHTQRNNTYIWFNEHLFLFVFQPVMTIYKQQFKLGKPFSHYFESENWYCSDYISYYEIT